MDDLKTLERLWRANLDASKEYYKTRLSIPFYNKLPSLLIASY